MLSLTNCLASNVDQQNANQYQISIKSLKYCDTTVDVILNMIYLEQNNRNRLF